MYDYIIIGAGLTGITLCKKLKEKGINNILILEAKSEPGGLCTTKNIDGHILDIGGGHFFYTKYKEIFDYIFEFVPKSEFNYFNRITKLKIGNNIIDYPIESNLWQFPIKERIKFLISVIGNGKNLGHNKPENYEEWIRWKLGNKICDEYMLPYNYKLWGVEPSEIDIDWLYKVPELSVIEILKLCIEKKQDKAKIPTHIYFYYPKCGGFQSIVSALCKDEMKNIVFNKKVNKLYRENDIWIINDEFQAKNVINTTPWNDLFDALGKPEILKNDFYKIKYNKIVISLYEKNYDVNWHWCYIPDMNKPYHRKFYINNFAKDSKTNGIYLETNIKRFRGEEKTFGGKMLFYHETDAAYPIPIIGHSQAIKNILEYYKPLNLFGVGRWGQHQHQNADLSMFEAIKFVNEICYKNKD